MEVKNAVEPGGDEGHGVGQLEDAQVREKGNNTHGHQTNTQQNKKKQNKKTKKGINDDYACPLIMLALAAATLRARAPARFLGLPHVITHHARAE